MGARVATLMLVAGLLEAGAWAQHPREVWLPMPSPRASVTQVVAATTISVEYSRPAVRERAVWGALVPWGEPWRAGADENTRFSVSTPVTVAGKSLAAGTYGLHVIPAQEGNWAVAFSRDADAWGSYAYQSDRDALRVEVTPGTSDHTEHLSYSFEALSADGVELVLRWEKLAVRIPIAIDRIATVRADLERQLTGLPQFYPASWSDAGRWAVENGQLELAEGWIARSLGIQETFAGRIAESQLRAAQGRTAEAAASRAAALAIGTVDEVHQLGRTLLRAGSKAEALEIFRANANRFPDSWVPLVGLARGLAVNGQGAEAAKVMRQAAAKAPEAQREYLEGLAQRLDRGESIE